MTLREIFRPARRQLGRQSGKGTRYCQLLVVCQRHGRRIGALESNGWMCVVYLMGGTLYWFRHGFYRAVNSETGETIVGWQR